MGIHDLVTLLETSGFARGHGPVRKSPDAACRLEAILTNYVALVSVAERYDKGVLKIEFEIPIYLALSSKQNIIHFVWKGSSPT